MDTWPENTAQAEAADAQFSIDDYGRLGDNRPYQVVQPAYDAPEFLQQFATAEAALQECKTLCHLEGKPFRTVRWERVGSGNRGGVRCEVCRSCPSSTRDRFPRHLKPGSGALHGYPNAIPIAEVQPNGQHIVFKKCGAGKIVGTPDYVVSRTPFPREYHPRPLPQRYLEAVRTAQRLSENTGKRAFICSSFGAPCNKRNDKYWTPVVYVDPGGLRERHDSMPAGTVKVNSVTPAYFKELVAESRGATYLGQGA